MTNCEFFEKCGACSFLDLTQEDYRKLKRDWLKGLIAPLGDDFALNYVWIGAKSRRRLTLQVSQDNKIGFFGAKSNDLVEIDSCFVAEEEISRFLPILADFLAKIEQNLVKKVQLTLFDNVLDVMFFVKRPLNQSQEQKFAQLGSVSWNFDGEVHFLPNYQVPVVKNLRLASNVFLQATKVGLDEIVANLRDFVRGKKLRKAVDLYAGFGVYSLALRDLVGEVSAFEGSQEMVDLMKKNGLNGVFRDLFAFPLSFLELKNCDLVVINPPRNGALPQIREIADSGVRNLVYVSCNVKSFVRDCLILLEKGFKIEKMTAIDQFFGARGLELVVCFVRD